MRTMKRMTITVALLFSMLLIMGSALADALVLPAGTIRIEEEAFAETGATAIVLPETLEYIGQGAFRDSSISDVFLPDESIQLSEEYFTDLSDFTIHAYMGSPNANWALDHGYRVTYITGDDVTSGGWAKVNQLIATESTSPESNNPYYTKRLIVRLNTGYSLPDLSRFEYKEIVPLNKNRYVIQFDDSQKTQECAAALEAWEGCTHVEKDYFLSFTDIEYSNNNLLTGLPINESDPMGFELYTNYLGSNVGNVKIAVIDTGVNSGIGCTLSNQSFDFATNSYRTSGFEPHGTNVSNKICEAFGFLSSHLTIIGYNIKVRGEISYLYMVEAIERAREDGADFINISIAGDSTLSGEQENLELREAIADFESARGYGRILAAAGNHADSASRYIPGKYCTAVGAVQFNSNGVLRRADQTCTGAQYSGFAPNTSYASAKVTAAKALLSLDMNHSMFPLLGTPESGYTILEGGAPMPKMDDLVLVLVEEIILNDGSPIESSLEVGDRLSIDFEVTPGNATDSRIKSTISPEDGSIIEKVSDNETSRVRIRAVAPGNATITFSSYDGNAEPVIVPIRVIRPVDSVTITGYNGETIMKNETYVLTAEVLPGDATDKSILWTSSDPNEATVDETTGVVTQVGDGVDVPVVITATSRSNPTIFDQETIIVSSIPNIVRVVVEPANGKDYLNIGKTAESVQMLATVFPDGTNPSITWSVDHPEIATIDENGLLTAVSGGQVIVTATATSVSSSISGYCGMSVIQLPVYVIIVGPDTVEINKSAQLHADIRPNDALNKNVHWLSNNLSAVTVSDDGVVTGIGEGQAVIMAISDADGTVFGTKIVSTVIPPESITINPPATTTLDIGNTLQLTATISPSNVTNKTISWSSDDISIISVDSSTGIVTANRSGTASISVETYNGKTDSISITVQQPYTLVFDSTGGTSVPNRTCYSDNPIGDLPIPIKDYYNFAGWYTAASGGLKVDAATSFTSSSTVTIYAHWTKNLNRKGDINLDGEITETDMDYLREYLNDARTLNEQALINADINEDGIINSADLLALRKILIEN